MESNTTVSGKGKEKAKEWDSAEFASPWVSLASSQDASTGLPRVVYEINTESNKLEPRLRVLVNTALPQAEVVAGMDGEVIMENENEDMKDNVKVMELPVLTELEGGQEHSPPSESSPDGGQLEEGMPNTGTEAEIQSPGTLSSSGNVESEPIIPPPPSCVLSLPGYVPKSLPDLNICSQPRHAHCKQIPINPTVLSERGSDPPPLRHRLLPTSHGSSANIEHPNGSRCRRVHRKPP